MINSNSVDIDAEIDWERTHPITNNLIGELGRDQIRLSKNQRETIAKIVGKMEIDLYESKEAQHKLRNHIIWHIEKNRKPTAIYESR